MSKYGIISGSFFPVFEGNTEIYGVNLRILSEYRKILTGNNSVFGHFSRSGIHVVFKITSRAQNKEFLFC